MKKLLCIIVVINILSTSALASDLKKAEEIFDQLTELLSKSPQIIKAHAKRDMTTCYRLEELYAPKIKELYQSASILDPDYSYTFKAAGALEQCLSCYDTAGSCEYAIEIMQKASDELKKRKEESKE